MTANDLRRILSEEIEKVRAGTTTPDRANAISNAVGKILASVRLELAYCKQVGRVPNIPLLAAAKK